jgi:hypothetical protein
VDRQDEFLSRNMDAADRMTKREDQLRRATRDLRRRVAKRTEADDFRTFIVNCNKFAISVLQICHLNIKLKLTVGNEFFFIIFRILLCR